MTVPSRLATVTRFAPSPTGLIHLGHAYAALVARDIAQSRDGTFLLRLEDIDVGRCRPEFADAIEEDLHWLGLEWPTPIMQQSDRLAAYADAIAALEAKSLLYPCFCTRRDIQQEIIQASSAPHATQAGPDGPIYPGICRDLPVAERDQRVAAGQSFALRLKMDLAIQEAGPLTWTDDTGETTSATPEVFGDLVLARKDIPTSYHLAVVVDDNAQGITLVTRGEDLRPATHVHRLLQALLNFESPRYHHHRLVTDSNGKKFSKRDQAVTLRHLRESGHSAAQVIEMTGFSPAK